MSSAVGSYHRFAHEDNLHLGGRLALLQSEGEPAGLALQAAPPAAARGGRAVPSTGGRARHPPL